MNPEHHLERSLRYLRFVSLDIAAGEYPRAANALVRSASHAVTAGALRMCSRHYSRRRLNSVLQELVLDRGIPFSHIRTFRDVHNLEKTMTSAGPEQARRMLHTHRRRVARLVSDIASAIAEDPAPAPRYESLDATPAEAPVYNHP